MTTTLSPNLKPGEVADLFSVDVKTVARWADSGRLKFIRTPGGHRRFPREVVEAALQPQGGAALAEDAPVAAE